MTIKEAIKTKEDETLLSWILKKPGEFLIANNTLKLTPSQQKEFKTLRKKMLAGWPLAYLTGEKYFYGRKFKVNPNVLIPRPETEQLIDLALKEIKIQKPKLICDIGTGSGIIITTVSIESKSKAEFYAVDISEKALIVAKTNFRANKKSRFGWTKFLKGNLLFPILKAHSKSKDKQGWLILANLPYLSAKQLNEPSIKKEPRLALHGGKNSTDLIFELLEQADKMEISKSSIILETDPSLVGPIKKQTGIQWPASNVSVAKDLNGLDRFVTIRI